MKYVEAVQGLTNYECSGIIEEIRSSDSYKQNGEVNILCTSQSFFMFNFV